MTDIQSIAFTTCPEIKSNAPNVLVSKQFPGTGKLVQSQQFCLRWHNYQKNLMSVFDQHLQQQSLVDVTLSCEGYSIKAHKIILSACSPYFATLFFDNPCRHPVIIMRDVKWPELKAIVDFMYRGEINVSQEQIGPLLKVAETLQIRGLGDVNGDEDDGDVQTYKTLQHQQQHQQQNHQQLLQQQAPPVSAITPIPTSAIATTTAIPVPEIISTKRESAPLTPTPTLKSASKRRKLGPSPVITTPSHNNNNNNKINSNTASSKAAKSRKSLAPLLEDVVVIEEPTAPTASVQPKKSKAADHASSYSIPPPLESLGLIPTVHHEPELSPNVSQCTTTTTDGSTEAIDDLKSNILDSSWLSASSSSLVNDKSNLIKMKAPTWSQSQLREAIGAVVTQKLRFTQASARYNIPKGTLYDNILGKSNRMQVLEEADLNSNEENAVLEFCCDVSISPYNRRTKKPLLSILEFVQKLTESDTNCAATTTSTVSKFDFTGKSGFKWWWAFCKKHSIISLHYGGNSNAGSTTTDNEIIPEN